MQRLRAAWLTAAYLLVLFGLTLGGFYNPHAPRNFVPFQSIEHDLRKGGSEFLVNLVGNLVAFFPMGWLLPALLGLRCSAIKVVGLSMALSLLIEALQGISGQRVADVDDVILNTLSGLIGYGLWLGFVRVRGWRRPADQQA